MMMKEEESKEEEREREKVFDEKEKKKSVVDDERSRLKSNNNDDDEGQNDGDGSIPESVLKEFEEFLLLLNKNNNENVTNSITFSETQLSLPVRVLIHQMVKEKGKNMLGSRTISETNQIRAFRKLSLIHI